jgi:hypothetical protein
MPAKICFSRTPLDLVRRQSSALSDPAPERFQIIALSDGLDPFGNDLDGEALADMEDRLDNGTTRDTSRS